MTTSETKTALNRIRKSIQDSEYSETIDSTPTLYSEVQLGPPTQASAVQTVIGENNKWNIVCEREQVHPGLVLVSPTFLLKVPNWTRQCWHVSPSFHSGAFSEENIASATLRLGKEWPARSSGPVSAARLPYTISAHKCCTFTNTSNIKDCVAFLPIC